jgi:site-specific DNA-methyltransferase (adenine-specific)
MHRNYTKDKKINIFWEDCIDVLKAIKSDKIDTVITDPPYGINFCNAKWDYHVPSILYWQEMLRVVKPGAYLLTFGGERTFHRVACNIEDAGWRLVGTLIWLYSSGMPKGLNVGKAIDKKLDKKRKIVGTKLGKPGYSLAKNDNVGRAVYGKFSSAQTECAITAPASADAEKFDGYNTALKPAFEPIILAMKPLDGTYADNAQKWGVAGLNIDACRIPTEGKDKERHLAEWKRFQSAKAKENTVGNMGLKNVDISTYAKEGRWPANVIFDESEAEKLNKLYPEASRYFFCSKASKKERGSHNDHLTVKPRSLMEWLCLLTRPPHGGIVLDPFMGSGTTCLACIATDRRFIGIEKDKHYYKIAKKRIVDELKDRRTQSYHNRC